MNSDISFHEEPNREDEEEVEEALSLSDFPLNSDERNKKDSSKAHHSRRASFQPSDSFEFSNGTTSENISHAEDIISCGKLVPYNRPIFDEQILKSASGDYDSINLSRRYCDSLPELNPTRSNTSASVSLTRSSRSLDSGKLRRNSSLVMKSEASDVHWSYSKRSAKSEGFAAGSKPRWYYLMFGSVKFPPEMDIRDMKNRQVRRSPGKMFPVAPVNRRSSWGHDLLRVLSCKNHPSVAAASPVGLVPQV